MNILVITTEKDGASLALCAAEAGRASCILRGALSADEIQTIAEWAEPDGAVLHRAVFEREAGLPAMVSLLDWLDARNIRVDLVVHTAQVHGDVAVIRLTESAVAVMADYPACYAALASRAVVHAWEPDCPQFGYLGVRPFTAEGVAREVMAAGFQAPTSCPKSNRVRCESCAA
ncbi:hypothetical protein [Paraburkholderia sp. A3RO-2L]|jgi:hypothetical protein|uniref:hypothetical protein n=1 Tax=unclassified Paraburkholderia TaxID=2615204 RepID=UPI003DAA4287